MARRGTPQKQPILATGQKRAALYSRVSTLKEEQSNALEASLVRLRDFARARGFIVAREFKDRLTGKGAREDRADYAAMVEAARRREVDVILATRLDRLARSTKELVLLAEDLAAWGVDLVILDQPIDTTSAMGRFIFTLFAALATLERENIVERVKRGLETARRRGHRLGRPKAHADLVPRAREMRAAGVPERAVARELGVPPSWVRRNTGSLRGSASAGEPTTTVAAPHRSVFGPLTPGGPP